MRTLLRVVAVLLFAAPARADNPDMSADFRQMMGWLSNEVVQGLAFNAGSTFDPPNEVKPWRVQPDISLGMGMLPLDKKKFPKMSTPALEEKNPSSLLPSMVTFPNLALHLRIGLPRRYDLTIRGANMTVPKGYRLSNKTQGDGQSNSIGFGLRKHLFGGNRPLLTVGANFNHVKGYFNFKNGWERVELTPGFQVDSQNTGRLEWNVNSLGANAIVSQTYGIWTPFAGLGGNYMTGSMKARLQADFASPLITPAIGEASDHPEQYQARVIVGTQLDRSRFSLFINGEMKAIGSMKGRTFIVQTGLVCPFRIGSTSLAARGTKRMEPRDIKLAKEPWDLDDGERYYMRNAPASKPAVRTARASGSAFRRSEPELEQPIAREVRAVRKSEPEAAGARRSPWLWFWPKKKEKQPDPQWPDEEPVLEPERLPWELDAAESRELRSAPRERRREPEEIQEPRPARRAPAGRRPVVREPVLDEREDLSEYASGTDLAESEHRIPEASMPSAVPARRPAPKPMAEPAAHGGDEDEDGEPDRWYRDDRAEERDAKKRKPRRLPDMTLIR